MYIVTTDDQSGPQIDALPAHALAPFAELRAMLEVAPWSGDPHHPHKPEGVLRNARFGPGGEGMALYLILDDLRRVDLVTVMWLDLASPDEF